MCPLLYSAYWPSSSCIVHRLCNLNCKCVTGLFAWVACAVIAICVVAGVAAGSINTSPQEKRRCASDSARWNKAHAHNGVRFKDALSILRHMPDGLLSANAQTRALQQRYPAKHAQPVASAAAPPSGTAAAAPAKQPLAENAAAKQPAGQLAGTAQATPASAKPHKQATDLTGSAAGSKAQAQTPPAMVGNKRAQGSDVVVLDDAAPSKRAATAPAQHAVPAGGGTIDLT